MAKKAIVEAVKVLCVDCKHSPGVVDNFLVDCNSKAANPGGFKKGSWKHVCKYFERK